MKTQALDSSSFGSVCTYKLIKRHESIAKAAMPKLLKIAKDIDLCLVNKKIKNNKRIKGNLLGLFACKIHKDKIQAIPQTLSFSVETFGKSREDVVEVLVGLAKIAVAQAKKVKKL